MDFFTLLSISNKRCGRAITERVIANIENHEREEQGGFMRGGVIVNQVIENTCQNIKGEM